MIKLEAGKLRHRVTIETPSATRDSVGGVLISWQSVETTWASITPLSGRELDIARQSYADVTHSITMRVPDDPITNKERLKFGTRIFNLYPPLNTDERGNEYKILAKENLG